MQVARHQHRDSRLAAAAFLCGESHVQCLSNAFNEVAPYLIEDGHTMSASEVIITEDAWNKLSDGQKAAVSEAGKAAGQYCRELSSKIEEESKERLKEKGVTFIEVADKQPWKDACQSIMLQHPMHGLAAGTAQGHIAVLLPSVRVQRVHNDGQC